MKFIDNEWKEVQDLNSMIAKVIQEEEILEVDRSHLVVMMTRANIIAKKNIKDGS